jgi:hypothetical protein
MLQTQKPFIVAGLFRLLKIAAGMTGTVAVQASTQTKAAVTQCLVSCLSRLGIAYDMPGTAQCTGVQADIRGLLQSKQHEQLCPAAAVPFCPG